MKDQVGLPTLQWTKEYHRFNILPANRIINNKHVQKMLASIRMMGTIRPVICTMTNCIDGTTRRYVIDGQHLLKALESDDREVPYIIIDVTNEIDMVNKMAMLNNSTKSWGLPDYINAYKMYVPDYMKLHKLHNLYSMDYLFIAQIGQNSLNNTISQQIKLGRYSFTNDNTEKMCKLYRELILRIGGNVEKSLRLAFLKAFLTCYGSYKQEIALKNIDKHIKTLRAFADADALNKFVQIEIFQC